MKRGDIYLSAARGAFSGKPRPVVIIQDDRFNDVPSVTVCPFTTDETDSPLVRPTVAETDTTGLERPSQLMVDKVFTVPRANLGPRVGRLTDADVLRLNRALVVFLGLAA